MIGEVFVGLCRVPFLKKRLWLGLYEVLARRYRNADWSFMNYGFAREDGELLRLEAEDEPNRYSAQLYDRVAGAVDLRGMTVLEVGSGRGGGASFVTRYMKPARMVGVDLSPGAVQLCRQIHPVPGLSFQTGDAEHLPFDDASFDAVINIESSHCYPNLEAFFSEVHRVLKSEGHFLYADLHDRNTLDDWRRSLESSSLVIEKEADITDGVICALIRDDEHKQKLIRRLVPSILQPSFFNFAATRGSKVFEAFRSGSLAYVSFVAKKGNRLA